MKLLIVEDQKKAAAYLRQGLEENGFVVDVAGDGEEGLHLARGGDYDLLILDVLLPGRDGWSILTELRQAGRQSYSLRACSTGRWRRTWTARTTGSRSRLRARRWRSNDV